MADYEDVNGKPITISAAPPDYEDVTGRKVTFQQQAQPEKHGFFSDFARDVLPQTNLANLPRYANAALPMIGAMATPELGGAPGAAIGSLVSQALRSQFPTLLGKGPSDLGEATLGVGSDVAQQVVAPKIVGGVLGVGRDIYENGLSTAAKNLAARFLSSSPLKYTQSVKNAVAESNFAEDYKNALTQRQQIEDLKSSQLMEAQANRVAAEKMAIQQAKEARFGLTTLQGSGEDAIQNAAISTKYGYDALKSSVPSGLASTVDESPLYAKDSLGRDLLDLWDGKEGASTTKLTKRVLSSPQEVQQFKMLSGGPEAAEQLALNDVLKGNTPESFDPDRIIKTLNGAKSAIYSEAISPSTVQRLKDFTDAIKESNISLENLPEIPKFKALPKVPEYQGPTSVNSSLITYVKHRLAFAIPGAVLGGYSGGKEGAEIGGAAAFILGPAAISKLMSDPQIAALTVQAVKTGLQTPQAGLISKALLTVLRGSEAYLTTPKGGQEKVTIGENGQPQYPQTQKP